MVRRLIYLLEGQCAFSLQLIFVPVHDGMQKGTKRGLCASLINCVNQSASDVAGHETGHLLGTFGIIGRNFIA